MVADSLDALRGLRVLVVEDEPLIAMALADELEARGALVLGPAASVEAALISIEQDDPQAVVLDVELRGMIMTPIAEALSRRSVPYILTTGHDSLAVPAAYRDLPRCMKPATTMQVLATLCAVLDG